VMHVYILTLLLGDDIANVVTATFDFTFILNFNRIQQDHPGYFFWYAREVECKQLPGWVFDYFEVLKWVMDPRDVVPPKPNLKPKIVAELMENGTGVRFKEEFYQHYL
jgi:hypothetical protein